MRYLMFVCGDGESTPESVATMREAVPAWAEQTRGVRLGGHALADPATAATVRVRDGVTVVTDGPFVETKEQVGGFDVLDCADLDEAIEIAAKHPVSWFHTIEVRPTARVPGRPPRCPSLGPSRCRSIRPVPLRSASVRAADLQ